MNQDKELEYEKNILKQKLVQIEDSLEDNRKTLKELPSRYKSNPFLLQSMMNMTLLNIDNIEKNIARPYFARLDIEQNGKNEKLYIGKIGVIDNLGNTVVTDWRTPIASIYYDGNLGETAYNAPGGVYSVDLKLKRQIQIENYEVLNIYDVDSVSDDELLKPYLSANMDGRLKNIIATIQKEQNNIIRENVNKNIIVQGVAGSGKTTVALHKIAYDVYNFSNRHENYKFLVIGPNKVFLRYISSVLPDLDTGGVKQITIQELLEEYVDDDIKIRNESSNIEEILDGNKILKIQENYKGSMEYKENIDKYISDRIDNIFEKLEDFRVETFKIIDKKEIIEMYKSLKVESINSKINYLIEYYSKKISNNCENLYSEIWKILADKLKITQNFIEKEKIKKDMLQYKSKISKGLRSELKKYFKSFTKLKSKVLYDDFISNSRNYIDEKSIKLIGISDMYLENDMPAILYIEYLLKGPKEFENIIVTVIDEAQDLSPFAFYVINKILKKSSICIFGDLAQGIYSYKSVKNWEEVNSLLDNKFEIKNLRKSYRNTIEITKAANKILERLDYISAEPVVRHGDEVRIFKTQNACEQVEELIKEYDIKGYKSCGIITKTSKEAKRLFESLKNRIPNIALTNEEGEHPSSKINIIPSYLSKGLEYDTVILINVNSYGDNELENKLLYVSYTRAMHKLDVINTV